MAQQSLASEGIGIGTSVNYGSNDIGADIAGGISDAGDASKEEEEPVGGFGFPSIKLPKFNRGRNNNTELNPAEAYANEYATETNRAGQQSLTESQRAIRGWVSPIPGAIGTQEGAEARVRGAGTPAPTPTSRAYVNNARDYSSINNMNALGRQAQEANRQAYGQGTRDYSSLSPNLSSQFAKTHTNANSWLGNQLGKLGEPLGAAWDAIEPSGGLIGDIPEFLGKIREGAKNNQFSVENMLNNQSGNTSNAGNTAATAGAAAAIATGIGLGLRTLGTLDIANQLLQIYYDD